jgi:hypothetical protein
MLVKALAFFILMKQFEILYRHFDMPSEYRGYTLKWARDKATAIKLVTKGKPNKNGITQNKKGATIQILEVNEVHTSEES